MPSHNHTQATGYSSLRYLNGSSYMPVGFGSSSGGSAAAYVLSGTATGSATIKEWALVGSNGGGAAHNHGDVSIIQPTVTLNWIVKAIMLIPNQSTVVNDDSDSTVNVYSCDYMNDLLDQMKREAFDFAHPIGSYYETSDSTWTPQAAGWYGTWVADNDGSALVSYKSSGAFNKATGTIVGGESQSYTPAGNNTGTAVTMNAVELTHSGGAVGNHTLTTSEIPSHNHAMKTRYDDYNWDNGYGSVQGVKRAGAWAAILSDWSTEYGGTYDFEKNWPVTNTGGGGAHNHGFTQPSKHSFTPTTKSITQPTFTGTAATLSTIQTSKVVYRWHRTA